MGNAQGGLPGQPGQKKEQGENDKNKDKDQQKRKLEAAPPTHVGRKKKKNKGPAGSAKLPSGLCRFSLGKHK